MAPRGPYLDRNSELGDRVIGGYAWIINKFGREKTYLRCRDRNRRQCRATGQINRRGILTTTHPHSHPPNPVLEEISAFIGALYDMTVGSLRPIREIYDAIDILYPEAVRQLPFNTIRVSMNRWRRAEPPPEPTSFLNMQYMLESNEYNLLRSNTFGMIQTACLRIPAQKTAMVFGDARFALPIQITKLYVSTTTRVLPPLNNTRLVLFFIAEYLSHVNTQLLYLNCMESAYGDLLAFPFAWALVENPDAESYRAILQYVRQDLAANVRNLLTDVYTDIDIDLRQRVAGTFYDADIHITFFDFCRVMISYVGRDINLENEDHAVIFKKFLGLALLPSDAIQNGLTWLTNTMSPELHAIFAAFANTFLHVFVEGLGVESLSFYRNYEAFKDVGQMHAQHLLNKVGETPNAWTFMAGIHKILEATMKNSVRLTEDPHTQSISTTPRVRYSIPYHKLKTLWSNHDSGSFSTSDFLACASFLMDEYFRDILYQRETTVARVVEHVEETIEGPAAPNADDLLRELDIAELPIQHHPPGDFPENDPDFDIPIFAHEEQLLANLNENATAQLPENEDPYIWLCQTCNVRRVQEICVPCHHVALCSECAEIRRQTGTHDTPLRCQQCNDIALIKRAYLPHDEGGDWKCQICNNTALEVIVKPCFHVMMCTPCSIAVQNSATVRAIPKRCPFCNVVADSFESVKIQRRNPTN